MNEDKNQQIKEVPRVNLVKMGFLYALTPMYPGSGQELSAVDLPIQRETHTEYPVVYSSSLKGSMREWYERRYNGGSKYVSSLDIFGATESEQKTEKEGEKQKSKMGMLSVSDARVLFFPVRSNLEPYVYVTCPFVLKRFLRDLETLIFFAWKRDDSKHVEVGNMDELKNKIKKEMLRRISQENYKALLVYGGRGKHSGESVKKVYFEDMCMEVLFSDSGGLNNSFEKLVNVTGFKENILSPVFLVPDDIFKYLVKHATEVRAHIKVKDGVTETGSLRYQEYLNEDTVLYFMSFFISGSDDESENAFCSLREVLGDYIQIGGDFTLGKGFCKLSWY